MVDAVASGGKHGCTVSYGEALKTSKVNGREFTEHQALFGGDGRQGLVLPVSAELLSLALASHVGCACVVGARLVHVCTMSCACSPHLFGG